MGKKYVGVVSMEDDGEVRIQLTEDVGEQMGLTEGRLSVVAAERMIKATPA